MYVKVVQFIFFSSTLVCFLFPPSYFIFTESISFARLYRQILEFKKGISKFQLLRNHRLGKSEYFLFIAILERFVLLFSFTQQVYLEVYLREFSAGIFFSTFLCKKIEKNFDINNISGFLLQTGIERPLGYSCGPGIRLVWIDKSTIRCSHHQTELTSDSIYFT